MFWNNFVNLCNNKGKSPTAVISELGISRGSVTHWRTGKVPHHNTLLKIADYFNVTVDYLLGKTDDPSPSNNESDSPERDPELIELENGLTPEELVELKRYAAYLLSQRNKK